MATMAKVRVDGLGRLLLIVVSVVLALPTVAGGAYEEHAAAVPARTSAIGAGPRDPAPTGSRDPAPMAADAPDHPKYSADRGHPRHSSGHPRRSSRASVAYAAHGRSVTPVSTAEPVWTDGGTGITAPLTGRQAVPLSRSGELPVHHGVFRC
ncbi:hypothetical protein SSP35_70_00030 [Streptomyces sp. NBRC 110611]|uniref:hypothetical protein n=1 Tax=Streptomyces sp. NBRC 110611 TaxID=1621259 RepID=UPI0008581441|nr:hypothetical protein [Streptomyces sp. NBRC 110611]GAU71653.1 hypothetical protein SSP35_70_00030 [Streptomyces sp. NBRC 110611]